MNGVIIGIYVVCLAQYIMAYLLLDSIKCKLNRIERYLEKKANAADKEET